MDSSSRGNKRVNLAISGWICIVIGSGVILGSGASGLSFAIATPISISGIVLLMAAIGMTNGDGLSIEEIRAWSPEGDLLPDAGGPMYRVDTTLIPPIKTTILCGRCGNLEMIDGPRPSIYGCEICEIDLWEEE